MLFSSPKARWCYMYTHICYDGRTAAAESEFGYFGIPASAKLVLLKFRIIPLYSSNLVTVIMSFNWQWLFVCILPSFFDTGSYSTWVELESEFETVCETGVRMSFSGGGFPWDEFVSTTPSESDILVLTTMVLVKMSLNLCNIKQSISLYDIW